MVDTTPNTEHETRLKVLASGKRSSLSSNRIFIKSVCKELAKIEKELEKKKEKK
jgi:hypothetical protein